MEDIFKHLFTSAPSKEDNGIYYFGDESDGDQFDNGDIAGWQNGIFSRNWLGRKLLENTVSRHLLDEIIANNEYIVDLACGPGMGFIPSIKHTEPEFRCLATDANPFVLSEWKRYLKIMRAAAELISRSSPLLICRSKTTLCRHTAALSDYRLPATGTAG